MAGGPENPVEWLRQIALRDRDAFDRLYDRFAPLVFSFALRLLRERSLAEDLLQEVLLQVWREAGSYNPERGSPEAWIITMTRSRAIDRLRSIRRRDRSFVGLADPGGKEYDARVEGGTTTAEAKLMVNSALTRLSEAQRKVLELAYFDGLTQSEIAERLNEPLGTVKTRMRAALTRLRELFGAKVT